ncbi:MAG TPA: nucleotide exchange factor GrpE [Acidimicrobiales bacterium]|jgi:molecular chaperone GrpE|nr:nucleotide exchange factor GrpE [Acidimicrobiales bacterium]
MSFSDEAAHNEQATPEPTPDADEVWSEADAAAVEAEAEADAAKANGEVQEADPLTVLQGERDEYLLALQRTQADFENYRKRISRMQEEQSARAASDLVAKLLPVLDTLDLAQAHQSEASAESEDARALTAARSMVLDVLAKEGLERVDQDGVPFDPMVHDAVSRSDDEDVEEGSGPVIDAVLRAGYRWRGQVLRPAMVSVKG